MLIKTLLYLLAMYRICINIIQNYISSNVFYAPQIISGSFIYCDNSISKYFNFILSLASTYVKRPTFISAI